MARDALIDTFDDAAGRCVSLDELAALVADAARDLGFDHVALLHHASLTSARRDLIRIHNYPDAWAAAHDCVGLGDHDPVHLACGRTLIGFAWEDVGLLVPVSARGREIMALSGRFGLGEGFTVPAHVPGEPTGSCSFAMRSGRPLPHKGLLRAEQLGRHAFEAARRLRRQGRPAAAPPRFSRRELQCLRLVAAGKSDWEIAAILGLSRETSRQYVKRARAAYEVATRTQLTVLGLRDGLIGFDDAIHP